MCHLVCRLFWTFTLNECVLDILENSLRLFKRPHMTVLQGGEKKKDRKQKTLYSSAIELDAMEWEASGSGWISGQAPSSWTAHGPVSTDRVDSFGPKDSANDKVGEVSYHEGEAASTVLKPYHLYECISILQRDEVKIIYVDWDTNAEQHYNFGTLEQPLLDKTAEGVEEKRRKMLESCTLHDCLKHEFDSHTCAPGTDNMWKCGGCNETVNGTTSLHLWRLPDILLIGLKRFKYSPERKCLIKIDQCVEFPLEGLDMKKYYKPNEGDDPIYDLYGVCYNSGRRPESGHCTSSVKCQDGKWRYFDDSWVTVDDERRIVRDGACLLFYRKRNLPFPSEREILEALKRNRNTDDEEQAVKYYATLKEAAARTLEDCNDEMKNDGDNESHQRGGQASSGYFGEQTYDSAF